MTSWGVFRTSWGEFRTSTTEDLAELIKQILTKNNFEFGDSHFLQIHGTEKPVAAHFNTLGHSTDDLSIMVIEKMKSEDPDLRKKRESYWIHHLQTLSPAGLNLDT